VFGALLQLRRAKWALETLLHHQHRHPVAAGGALAGASRSRNDACGLVHAWWALRLEVLGIVSQLYAHFTLTVVHAGSLGGPSRSAPSPLPALAWSQSALPLCAEWTRFHDEQLPAQRSLHGCQRAFEEFTERVAARCLLLPRYAHVRHALRQILSLALRLRMQLETIAPLSARTHAAAAERWREELQRTVRFVLKTLRQAAQHDGDRPHEEDPELLDLCRALNFSGFYVEDC
jgi:hypothetical protein